MRGTVEHIFVIALLGGSLLLPWRAMKHGEDPSPLWKPMGPDGTPCESFGWKYINGTTACGTSCPTEAENSFFGHCGVGKALGEYVTDGDADTLRALWIGASISMAVSLVLIFVARVAIVPLMLAILFTAPVVGVLLGARLAGSGETVGATIMMGASGAGMLVACAILSPVREAARVLGDAARIVTSTPAIIILSIMGTACRGFILAAGLYGSLAIMWPAVTLQASPNFLDRTISVSDTPHAYWAVGGVFVTLWAACSVAHLLDVAFAVFTIGKLGESAESRNLWRALVEAVRSHGATATTGALVVTITYAIVITLRYIQRRIKEIPGSGMAPIACCQCAWTAAAALSRVVLPVVYSSSVLYNSTLMGGMKWSLKLIASCPALFATTLASSALFASLQSLASMACAALLVTEVVDTVRLNTVVLALVGARLANWLVISPYQGCVHASLVFRCAAEAKAIGGGMTSKKSDASAKEKDHNDTDGDRSQINDQSTDREDTMP